jgi:Asp-tRNA(Asn)/Glu-tRNA(Gln) amidotransferase A subunit family amidase
MNVDESLARIAADVTNSVPVVFPDESRRMLADAPDGPLHGVPVTVKDMYALPWRGMFNGTRHELLPPQSSGMFRRLQAAGAVVVGIANQHELGMGATGAFSAYGECRNPVNVEYCPGGSSSGSAASVAAGLVDMSIGSDSGGSTRIPASFCGVLGLKLTYGSVPTDGYLGRSTTFSAPGTFARTEADLRVLTEAVLSRPLPRRDGNALRIGLLVDPIWRDLHPTIEARCRAALDGFATTDVSMPYAALAGTAATTLMVSEMAAGLPPHVLDGLHPFTRALAAVPHLLPAAVVGRANRVRAAVRRSTAELFEAVDFLAWPTSATPVPKLADAIGGDGGALRQAGFANLTGVPGISVPVGFDDHGLPVGLQLRAPWGEEARLLDAAATIEASGARLRA